jgi:hypothetical protein
MPIELPNLAAFVRDYSVELAGDVMKRIVRTTPIRSGQAKANWKVVDGAQADKEIIPIPQNDPEQWLSPGEAERMSIERLAAVTGKDGVITISNNLPYIGMLENGSSDQAPQGMVQLSVGIEIAKRNNES